MASYNLTAAEWLAARKRAMNRAVQLTKSVHKATELVDAAVADALDPDAHPWDPASGVDLGFHLCSLVWSRHGTELASYRVTHASERLTEAKDEAVPPSANPEHLVLNARDAARAERLDAALQRRVEGDTPILLLLERDADAEDDEEAGQDRPNAEPASTRRALAKGYTLKDIKNARERLKRHAVAVAKEDGEAKP